MPLSVCGFFFFISYCAAVLQQNNPFYSLVYSLYCEQKKERECMQLRLAVLRCELQRQRKALGREIDLQQKEKSQLQKKGRVFGGCFFFLTFVYSLTRWLFVASHTGFEMRAQAGSRRCLGSHAGASCIHFSTSNTPTVCQTYLKDPYYDHFQI